MSNPDASAYPVSKGPDANGQTNMCGGLTKREHFAGEAMKGLITTTKVQGSFSVFTKEVVESSVKMADALLSELEKVK